MTTVSRYGQGSRQAYGIMANIGVKAATANMPSTNLTAAAPPTQVQNSGNSMLLLFALVLMYF